jgi:hypothetical protein
VSEKVEGVVDRLCVVVVWVCCDTGGGAVRVTNDRRDQTREEARCYLYRSIRDERLGVVYLRGWIWSEGCDKVEVGWSRCVCVSGVVGLGFRPRETARFGGGQHAD